MIRYAPRMKKNLKRKDGADKPVDLETAYLGGSGTPKRGPTLSMRLEGSLRKMIRSWECCHFQDHWHLNAMNREGRESAGSLLFQCFQNKPSRHESVMEYREESDE